MLRRRQGHPKVAPKTATTPVKRSSGRLPRGRRKMIYILPMIIAVHILANWKIAIHYVIPTFKRTFVSKILGFHPEWHPSTRSERFPSVEERVKLYMSNWYLPPCNGTDGSLDERLKYTYDYTKNTNFPSIHITNYGTEENDEANANANANANDGSIEDAKEYVHVNAHVNVDIWLDTNLRPDEPVALWENALNPCLVPAFDDSYCPDLSKIVSLVKDVTKSTYMADLPPIIGQFGDHPRTHLQTQHVPFFKKFREAAYGREIELVSQEKSGLDCNAAVPDHARRKLQYVGSEGSDKVVDTFSPILWLLNWRRHFYIIPKVLLFDIPWESKNNVAVWRGRLTGLLFAKEREGKSFMDLCDLLQRCRFVRDNLNSKILDLGVSYQLPAFPVDDDHMNMVKGNLWMKQLMHYKAIIVIEGNDVASGLKWALYSRSVVLMAPPLLTSYAMEEMLVPWVHYVPLKADLSNAEEMMKWVIDNDEKARKIAERATLFIHDFLYHEDAEKDNIEVQQEMMRRYMAFFKE